MTLALGAGALLWAALPAEAAHNESGSRQERKHGAQDAPARVAENRIIGDPASTSSVASPSDSPAGCDRSRKRLFVEGEGWIVRKVTTCY